MASTYQILATPRRNGVEMPDAAITYTSTDEAVVTVNATGLVTAVANGEADVVVESGTGSLTKHFTVGGGVVGPTIPLSLDWDSHADTQRLSPAVLENRGMQGPLDLIIQHQTWYAKHATEWGVTHQMLHTLRLTSGDAGAGMDAFAVEDAPHWIEGVAQLQS